MIKNRQMYAMGWLPDYPSIRDWHIQTNVIPPKLKALGQKDSVREMLKKTGVIRSKTSKLPTKVDLSEYFSPIEDQDSIGSCTANATVGLIEYFEKRSFGKHLDASRLFLYKVTRNLLKWTGDTGAFLRTAMGAAVLFGIPPEEYYPYDIDKYDEEPPAFCYSFARNYQAINYFRLDPIGISKKEVLKQVKTNLAAGLPSMFGFSVYDSYNQAGDSGEIPFPENSENVVGGHAIVAVGYDDSKKIANTNPGSKPTVGAILFRNSWGTQWGDEGYGWLPYKFILEGLAVDWWALIKSEWIDTQSFKL